MFLRLQKEALMSVPRKLVLNQAPHPEFAGVAVRELWAGGVLKKASTRREVQEAENAEED